MHTAPWIDAACRALWGPGTLALLMGTGIFLTVRTRFLAWRNLWPALRAALSPAARAPGRQGVSPFSALMTSLAASIGTGNIVGVAAALTAGGPGALVWMELSALFGLSSQFAECMLAVKYRTRDPAGRFRGGPMYVMARALPRPLGRPLAAAFALGTVLASFGIGCMTQANSLSAALKTSFSVPERLSGAVTALLALWLISGGIRSIARVSSVLVPAMAALYLAAGGLVILRNLPALPSALADLVRMAFLPRAAAGGAAGTLLSLLPAVRWGVARGVFSNEAGMGSAAFSAAAADTDSPVRQGYLSMTATFFDTLVICTVTGLAICCSGALGMPDPATGLPADGAALTILAFRSALGPAGGRLVAVCAALFAFSSIPGWAFQGEQALAYLTGGRLLRGYRAVFAALCALGAVQTPETVFRLSDVFNAMMALPNLVCLLLLSGTVAREMAACQPRLWQRRPRRRTRRPVRREKL